MPGGTHIGQFPADSKRGISSCGSGYTAGTDVVYTQAQSQSAINHANPFWWYTYKVFKNGVTLNRGKFVPFFPDNTYVTSPNIDTAVADAGQNGYIMMYGEIDQGALNAITIADLATGWETMATDSRIVNANIKLVSPVLGSTISAGDRLDQFMSAITHPPAAMRVHTYTSNPGATPATNLTTLYLRINSTAAKYQVVPLWIGEWGYNGGHPTDQQVEDLFDVAMPAFEQDYRIQAYFYWYGGPISIAAVAPYNPGSFQLYDDSASPTPTGAYHKNMGG